jgi:hypothetical protein
MRLRDALLRAALNGDAIIGERDVFGQRFVIDFRMHGPRGEAMVRSTWIIRSNEQYPRLTNNTRV